MLACVDLLAAGVVAMLMCKLLNLIENRIDGYGCTLPNRKHPLQAPAGQFVGHHGLGHQHDDQIQRGQPSHHAHAVELEATNYFNFLHAITMASHPPTDGKLINFFLEEKSTVC